MDRQLDTRVAGAREAAIFLERMQRRPRDRLADGRSAWGELQRAAHGTSAICGKKLLAADADRMARHLHLLIERVEPALRARGVSMTDLAKRAFGPESTDSKNLYRLRLPPGEDPARRGIRRNARQFRCLIEALAELSGQNVELLADVVMLGTTLHPATGTTAHFDEMDYVDAALQTLANTVDREFDLFGAFNRTAAAKRACLQAGGSICWPHYDLEAPRSESDLEAYRAERIQASDPRQAFWRDIAWFGAPTPVHWQPYGFENGLVQDCSFFYVPHYPLGHLALWNLPDPREDRARYELALARELALAQDRKHGWAGIEPSDDFDVDARRPAGQVVERRPGQRRLGRADLARDGALQAHFWLVLYPDPNGRRIVPALYAAGEEGGAYLMPLNAETLASLGAAVWIAPAESMPLGRRLRQLLSDPADAIGSAWRRSAPWLAHNPLLQWAETEACARAALAATLGRLGTSR